jgi:hypothetical protein
MMNDYIFVGALLCGLFLLAGYMFLASRAHYLIKILLASALVLGAIYTGNAALSLYGFPVRALPGDGVVVLALDVDPDRNLIALWVEEKNMPRSYAVAYDPVLARKLLDAQARARETHRLMVLHWIVNGHGGHFSLFNDDSGNELNIDVVSAIPNKDAGREH